jgi:hypothetical protein
MQFILSNEKIRMRLNKLLNLTCSGKSQIGFVLFKQNICLAVCQVSEEREERLAAEGSETLQLLYLKDYPSES